MADENPLNPKKQTVRITLPPRMNEPGAIKRETVRIAQTAVGDKGQTIRIQPNAPSGDQPKKETTKIFAAGAVPPPPAAPEKPKSAPVPIIPPPPKPKSAPVPVIPPPPKAAGMPAVPPKPPGAFSVPGAKPPQPSAPAAAPAAAAPGAPLPPKPSVPKKETSRIPIPAAAPAPAAAGLNTPMPKATLKLQQTQPLSQAPVASVVKTPAVNVATTTSVVTEADPVVLYASIAVFLVSATAAVLSYLSFSACAS